MWNKNTKTKNNKKSEIEILKLKKEWHEKQLDIIANKLKVK